MNNEIERIKAYIERRRKARGLEFNGIHGFDVSPSGGFELTVSDIETLIAKVESLAADAERLEWMSQRGARISWSMDCETCNVWLPAERDGTESRPAEGYPQKHYGHWREAIDAAKEKA